MKASSIFNESDYESDDYSEYNDNTNEGCIVRVPFGVSINEKNRRSIVKLMSLVYPLNTHQHYKHRNKGGNFNGKGNWNLKWIDGDKLTTFWI